jgi:hypothetical protein
MWIYECVKYSLINHSLPYSTICVISDRTMKAAQTVAANNWCLIHIVATVNYFACPRVTSPPTGKHKCCSRGTEGRRGIVLVWQRNARQRCTWSAPDDASAGSSVHTDYCCLFICYFSLYLSYIFMRFHRIEKHVCYLRHVCLCVRQLSIYISFFLHKLYPM